MASDQWRLTNAISNQYIAYEAPTGMHWQFQPLELSATPGSIIPTSCTPIATGSTLENMTLGAPSTAQYASPIPTLTPEMAEARMFGTTNASSGGTLIPRHGTDSSTFGGASSPISLRRRDSNPLWSPFRKNKDKAPTLIPDTAPLDDVAKSLGITDAFATLKNAAAACSIPVLSEAAVAAISILAVVSNTVRRARINDIGSTSLASHACNLISYIVTAQQRREREGRSLDQGLLEELGILVQVLYKIKNFLQQLNGRNRFTKAVMHKSDTEKVKVQRETLAQALAEFQFRSSINEQDRVAQIDKRLQDIKRDLVSMRSKSVGAIARELNYPHQFR